MHATNNRYHTLARVRDLNRWISNHDAWVCWAGNGEAWFIPQYIWEMYHKWIEERDGLVFPPVSTWTCDSEVE